MDTFPFILARDLGLTLAELEARMGGDEYLRWRAFYAYEVWKAEEAAREARVRDKAARS